MKLLVATILIFIFISSSAFAEAVFYNINVEIGDHTTYKADITLVNYSDSSFLLTVPDSPQSIKITSTLTCTIRDGVWGKTIECNTINPPERTVINIEYEADTKVVKKDSYYTFSDTFTMPTDIDKFSLIIRMPEATGLINSKDAYSPGNALFGSDGRKSFIYWNRENMQSGEVFDVSIAYENIGLVDYSTLGILLIIIIAIVVMYSVYMRYRSRGKTAIKIILPVLKLDEKQIFETIIKHDPGVKQKIIVTESGYSKAKVSKVLTNLQERGLVKLERTGRTNKIFYDEKFKKKA